MLTRGLIRYAISAAVLAVFLLHATGFLRYGLLDRIENFSYDARVVLTLPGSVDDRIVILDLDERSLLAEGQWPWPRNKLAHMVTQLFDRYHVRALGFDVVFAEPDGQSGTRFLNSLASTEVGTLPGFTEAADRIRHSLDNDRIFAEALAGRNVVLGYVFKEQLLTGDTPTQGALGPPLMDTAEARQYPLNFIKPVGFTGNLQLLQDSAMSAGFFDNPLVDDDGTLRRVPLIQLYQGKTYPSLALALARAAVGNAPTEFVFDPPEEHNALALESVRIGPFDTGSGGSAFIGARVDGNVAAWVPYRGPYRSFPYISATDVIQGTAPAAALEGRVVLVGTTSPGLLDFRVTPVGRVYPGVEVHANIISGMLDNRVKQKAPYYLGIEATMLVLIGALVAWAFPKLSPLGSAAATLLLIMAVILTSFWAWTSANFITPMGTPVVFTLALFLMHVLYAYLIEQRGRRDTQKKFGQYVPKEIVEEATASGAQISMEGDIREMTVLFSDVRGFTRISEKLEAKELSEMMNMFLTPLTRVIFDHRGTIDKYMGDAIMAFWGAPLADPEHPRHALEAAVKMSQTVRELDAPFAARGWDRIKVGIGLTTGVMRVGNMGSEFRVAYTVMGDPVNLGSRLEGLTKEYGVIVICSDTTKEAVPDWSFRELDLVRVKGREGAAAVAIWEPIGPKDSVPEDVRKDLLAHRRALRAYRNQAWDEAEREWFSLSRSGSAIPLYQLFLDRIVYFRNNPPPADWDGAFTFTTK